jgi:hypothetical protein
MAEAPNIQYLQYDELFRIKSIERALIYVLRAVFRRRTASIDAPLFKVVFRILVCVERDASRSCRSFASCLCPTVVLREGKVQHVKRVFTVANKIKGGAMSFFGSFLRRAAVKAAEETIRAFGKRLPFENTGPSLERTH